MKTILDTKKIIKELKVIEEKIAINLEKNFIEIKSITKALKERKINKE